MAFNYKKLEQFENAIQEYNKKIKLYQKVKEQNPNFYKYEIVQEYKDISRLYFHQKQYQKAIDIEMKILEIVKSFDESFIKKNLLMGAVYDRIGEDYELLENKEESIKNYNSALLFYRKDKNKNRKAIERVVLSLEKLELKIESK
jgi:tetratricopeptide (TPR) repeat protein